MSDPAPKPITAWQRELAWTVPLNIVLGTVNVVLILLLVLR